MHTVAGWSNAVSLTYFEKVMMEACSKSRWNRKEIYGADGKTKEHQIKALVYSGLPLPVEREYGRDISTDDMKELGTVTLNDVELALGSEIDMKWIEDNRHIPSFLQKLAGAFGKSFSQAIDLHAALPFIRAFSSANQTVYDGGAWCASRTLESPQPDGTLTYSNDLGSTSYSFSVMWDLHDKLSYQQPTERGLLNRSDMVKILAHNSHRRTAEKIFGQEYEPDTLTRNKNTLMGKGIKPVFCPDLPTNYKFALGESAKDSMLFAIRKSPSTAWEDHERNRTRSCFVHMRLIYGALSWTDVVGAQ